MTSIGIGYHMAAIDHAWALLKQQFHSAPLYDELRDPESPRDAFDAMTDRRSDLEENSEDIRDLESRRDDELSDNSHYSDDDEELNADYLDMLEHYILQGKGKQEGLAMDHDAAQDDYGESAKFHDPQAVQGREDAARAHLDEGIEQPIPPNRPPYGVSPARYDEPFNPFQKAWDLLKNWDDIEWDKPSPKPKHESPKSIGDDVNWKSEKELPPIQPMFPPSDEPPAPPGMLAEMLAAARARKPEPPLDIQRLPSPTTQTTLPPELTAGANVSNKPATEWNFPHL